MYAFLSVAAIIVALFTLVVVWRRWSAEDATAAQLAGLTLRVADLEQSTGHHANLLTIDGGKTKQALANVNENTGLLIDRVDSLSQRVHNLEEGGRTWEFEVDEFSVGAPTAKALAEMERLGITAGTEARDDAPPADDLTCIKYVGAPTAAKLVNMGIATYREFLDSMTPEIWHENLNQISGKRYGDARESAYKLAVAAERELSSESAL